MVTILVRAGARLGVAGLFLFGANDALQTAVAEGDTRTITFHHLHTDENITITYKRNGRYDDAALKKLDWFMRDWRREESTHMDPHLFDLLWEANRQAEGKPPQCAVRQRIASTLEDGFNIGFPEVTPTSRRLQSQCGRRYTLDAPRGLCPNRVADAYRVACSD